jgi:hypothetical protein
MCLYVYRALSGLVDASSLVPMGLLLLIPSFVLNLTCQSRSGFVCAGGRAQLPPRTGSCTIER